MSLKYRGYVTVGMYVELESDNAYEARIEAQKMAGYLRRQIENKIDEVVDADALTAIAEENR